MIRYPLAVALVLWYACPEWLQRARARGKIRAVIKLAAVSPAGFWGALRLRWRKFRHGPGRHCPAPRVLAITAADIGLADWRFSARRQSARFEDTMPGIPLPLVRPYMLARSS